MELSNIISVLIFLGIIIVPVVLLVRSGKKKKKAFFNKVNHLKAQYQLNISESDIWDNTMLGIDKSARKILWIKEAADGLDENRVVDLGKIAQCKKVSVSRMVKAGKESSQVLDQIGLELVAKNSTENPVLLDFYDSKSNYLFNFQLELQSKWQKLITECLRT